MKYRLYYWFCGTPKDRPGGPWWYRDFDTSMARAEYLGGVVSTLRRYARLDAEVLPVHDAMKIAPPEGLPVAEVTG